MIFRPSKMPPSLAFFLSLWLSLAITNGYQNTKTFVRVNVTQGSFQSISTHTNVARSSQCAIQALKDDDYDRAPHVYM